MSDKSLIEWTDATWNPIIGCSKCSPGCANCYAARMANRLRHMGVEGYTSHIELGGWTGNTAILSSRLWDPSHWKKPRRVFVCSMSDLFHENTPFTWIDQVFDAMLRAGDQHTWQVLTKRPARALAWMNSDIGRWTLLNLPNLWLGVTVCNQEEADEKIPLLLQIPAAVRWVSVEPMLGAIDLSKFLWRRMSLDEIPGHAMNDGCSSGIKILKDKPAWVVCGAETGPGKRPMNPGWARQLREQCGWAGVKFFFKKDSAGSRLLDGREWNEYPEVSK